MRIDLDNVLIVDDDSEFRSSLSKILSKANYKVGIAASGREASKLLMKTQYPLILLDLHIPEKSGLEVLKEVKEKYPASKVIIITANGESDMLREAQNTGAFAFLIKPVKRKVLLKHIHQALSHSMHNLNLPLN